MNKKHILFLVLTQLLILSCKDNSNHLSLRILNNKVVSSRIEISDNRIGNNYQLNTINYVLVNNSKNTYYILPPKFKAFNDLVISYGSIIIKDDIGNNIQCVYGGTHCGNNSTSHNELNMYFKDLGYRNTNLMNDYKTRCIVIHPKEKLFFENILGIPKNKISNVEYVELIPKEKYHLSLKIEIDTSFYKNRLTRSQLKNIEENKYKLYQGTIISENSVPIVFVNE